MYIYVNDFFGELTGYTVNNSNRRVYYYHCDCADEHSNFLINIMLLFENSRESDGGRHSDNCEIFALTSGTSVTV